MAVDDVIEAVAKAIYADDEDCGAPWDDPRMIYQDHYRSLAKAAIGALQELSLLPTPL